MTQAYRMAGVLKHPGQGLSGSEQIEGLFIGNTLINGLKAERLMIPQIVRSKVNVVPNQQEYSVCSLAEGADNGIVPDWPIERPDRILRAGFIVQGTPPTLESEIPMEVLLDYTQWWAIVTKNVVSSQPRVLYYRNTTPAGTAAVWPIPTTPSVLTLYTYGWIDGFDDVNDPLIVPDAWAEFLQYNWATAVHDRYPAIAMGPGVEARALDTKARVKRMNFTPAFIKSDPAAMQRKPLDSRRWYDARTWWS